MNAVPELPVVRLVLDEPAGDRLEARQPEAIRALASNAASEGGLLNI
jgi:hypothetical protein